MDEKMTVKDKITKNGERCDEKKEGRLKKTRDNDGKKLVGKKAEKMERKRRSDEKDEIRIQRGRKDGGGLKKKRE